MPKLTRSLAVLVVAAAALTGCGSGDDETARTSAGGGGGAGDELTITSPSDGAEVKTPFELTWEAPVPLGPPESGKDHVHVFVDGNEEDFTVVGASRFMVKDLSSGEHTVQISLQHADHSPVGQEDEITVVVSGGGTEPSSTSTPMDGGGGGYY